ncbi:MAG TPA: amidase [Beijerinckiaceae bacterium]|nr:amidase [Beijerinckiaceae bacterium]
MLRALDLCEALEAGDLAATTIVEWIAEAVAEREAGLSTFAHLDLDRLRLEARQPASGPLGGLPVAFKDIIDTADAPTEYGSPIYHGWRPRADAPIVCQTRAAGGLMLGKAVTTEFAFLEPAITRNPHDPARTPGGSSSGSAAGVAAGLMPLAFGTQTGGSVIRPASFCGVAAIKPSYRLLPMVGIKPGAWTLDTLGLFGARVADIAFGLSAITGRDLRVDGRDFGTPTFGVTRMPFAGAAAPEAEAALVRAIAAVEKSGGRIVEVDFGAPVVEAQAAHATIYNYEGGVALAWEIAHHRDRLSAILKQKFAPEVPITIADYDHARGIAKRARRAARELFAGFDALITFAAPGAAPDRSTTGDAAFNKLFTLLGTPAVNVPGCKCSVNMPVGLQVVAAFGQDHRALAAAHFLEQALNS